jgi:NADPH:quinone reductase
MKAIVLREFGGPEVLRLQDWPTPEAAAGEVAIDVQYVGVNFTDVRNRWGDGLGVLPFVPGVEVSGTVRAVGAGVTRFAVGQPVAAFTRGHAYAEVVTALADLTFLLPDHLAGQPQSAGMMVTVPLALNVVERAAAVREGEVVLLHAAAGGVGSVVGQLVGKIAGVRLYGTTGDASKAEYARGHGYAEVFGYDDFDRRLLEVTDGNGVDVVLDPVGGDLQRRSLELVAPFGRLVSYSNISRESQELPDAEWMRARCIGFVGLSNGSLSGRAPATYRQTLQRAVSLVAGGEVSIDVTEVFPLAQAAKAHEVFERRAAVGKLVLSA